MHKSRRFDGCWLACCLLASSAWCLSAAQQLSATFDEPLYIERGLERWRSGSHAGLMKLGTMPLAIDWDTLPLYVYERWTATPIDPVRDLSRALPWARAAALAFWWLLLVYGWLAGRELTGPWGGRLAVAWLACEPNLLAHASLATTDIAVSACLLALAYHFRLGRSGCWWRRIGVPGIWFAATLLAKASGLVFGPLCLLAVGVERTWAAAERRRIVAAGTNPRFGAIETTGSRGAAVEKPMVSVAAPRLYQLICFLPAGWRPRLNSLAAPRRSTLDEIRSSLRDIVHIAALGFALTLLYCGCDWRAEPSFVAWAQRLPEGRVHDAFVWFSEHLRIFSNAGEGLVRQVKHNMHGHHGSYLLGQTYPHPLWYYFPVALAIKLTLPLLVAPILVSLAARRNALNWALAAAMVLFLFSLNCRVQIGIRLVLPLVCFLIVGIAPALVTLVRQSYGWQRPAWAIAAAGTLLWTGTAAWRVWPEGLCYTNELWGGTANGYLCLSDSNYDWGQGVRELAAWPPSHGVKQLDVWYFGTDPAVNAAPLRQLPLHLLPIARPEDVPAFVQARYLAVGTTLLYGTQLGSPGHRSAAEYLRGRQPIARTSTFLIYDMGTRVANSPTSSGGVK
jgi:hypothetical protein